MAENENVDNLVIEQLRLLRSEMRDLASEMSRRFDTVDDRLETLEAGQMGLQGILVGVGRSVQLLENRVEHIEEKLGIDQ